MYLTFYGILPVGNAYLVLNVILRWGSILIAFPLSHLMHQRDMCHAPQGYTPFWKPLVENYNNHHVNSTNNTIVSDFSQHGRQERCQSM